MRIGFHTNQLSLRGTEIAMYDYAKYNEEILGNESYIVSKNPEIWKYSDPQAIQKFKERFNVFFYGSNDELQTIIKDNKTDVFYAQKAGLVDDVISKSCKTVVHAVFQYEEPHGNVYAYISEWLSNLYGNKHAFVPYMVDLPKIDDDLRVDLNIPKDAVVFGRHGGYETFDFVQVMDVVRQVALRNPNIYFLFLNTAKFSDPYIKNIIYLDGTADMVEKTKFINTCDAMLHARMKGESFGLAIAEFSIRNKPVLCSQFAVDKAHFDLLKDKGIYYSDNQHLTHLLENPIYLNDKNMDWNCYRDYSPEKIMEKFNKVFLQ